MRRPQPAAAVSMAEKFYSVCVVDISSGLDITKKIGRRREEGEEKIIIIINNINNNIFV